MILIPEQVRSLRSEILRLEMKKKEYEHYFKECDKSSMDLGFLKYADTTQEVDSYNAEYNKLKAYKQALVENEFMSLNKSDSIDYGSEFTVFYDDTSSYETYTLVQNMMGLVRTNINCNNGYISFDSSLGKAVFGKRKDDSFSYTVSLPGKKSSITITGKIFDVVKQDSKSVHFIISRPKSYRISTKQKELSKKLRKDNNTLELEKRKEITLSQYNLLKEEQERLLYFLPKLKKYEMKMMVGSIISLESSKGKVKKYEIVDKDEIDVSKEISINSLLFSKIAFKRIGDIIDEKLHYKKNNKTACKQYKGKLVEIDNHKVEKEEKVYYSSKGIEIRLGRVNRLLKNAKIATPPTDKTIGIGSKVSIMTFEDGKVQTKRVEVINEAVSTEISTDYVEVISALGQELIGLKNNQGFSYHYLSKIYNNTTAGTGIVYNINNNMYEEIADNPLTYQKTKRG